MADIPTSQLDTLDTQQLIASCIFATILQTATDCLHLMEKSTSVTSVSGMRRGALESYADLCTMIKDERYALCMSAALFQGAKALGEEHARVQGKQSSPRIVVKANPEVAIYKLRGVVRASLSSS